MIDYITIMRKIILFINSAVTHEKIDKRVNKAKKQLSKSQTIIYKIYMWSETLYLTVIAMFILGYLIYTKKANSVYRYAHCYSHIFNNVIGNIDNFPVSNNKLCIPIK